MIWPIYVITFHDENIIDVDYNSKKIYLAIKKALFNEQFIEKCSKCSNPYGIGNSATKVIKFLKAIKYNKSKILRKRMMLTSKYLKNKQWKIYQ